MNTNNNTICAKCKCFNACGGATCGAPCAGYIKITCADILERIHNTYTDIETRENRTKEYDKKWREYFERYKNVRLVDGAAAARIGAAMEKVRADEKTEHAIIGDLKAVIKILNNNYRVILFESAAPVICDVLSKYNNKPYGPKTAQKIKDEIKQRADVYFYINSRSYYDEIVISDDHLKYSNTLEISTRRDNNGDYIRILDDNNRIVAPGIDDLIINNTYVDDIAERIQDLKTAFERAKKLQNELKTACNDYNGIVVPGIDTISIYDALY